LLEQVLIVVSDRHGYVDDSMRHRKPARASCSLYVLPVL
jgi:hypothetical protein